MKVPKESEKADKSRHSKESEDGTGAKRDAISAQFDAAEILFDQCKWLDAIEAFTDCLKKADWPAPKENWSDWSRGYRWAIRHRIAKSHQKLGDFASAITWFTRLTVYKTLTPFEKSSAFGFRAECYLAAGDLTSALADENQSIDALARSINLDKRAHIFCKLNIFDLELSDLNRAITLCFDAEALSDLLERRKTNLARSAVAK
jgi:tetratricopeptide (TPR) repeat protein